MTDLSRLKVSLTKHNAHKVARLLHDYEASDVFARLEEVHAEAAQARKNLSTLPGDVLPAVWEKVRALGPDAIDTLVLIAVIFSHRDLIRAISSASDRHGFSGRVDRDVQLTGKAYTNFVRIVDQLGYASKIEHRGVTFDFKRMFEIPGLGPLVGELLELKLAVAKWDRSNGLLREVTRLGFQEVFGVSAKELRGWLASGAQPSTAAPTLSAKDQDFFQNEAEGSGDKEFKFKPGHIERDVEPVQRSASARSTANRLHNAIQNQLYRHLKGKLGAASVGTEVDTGSGTAIDLVTQHKGKTTFYEIKTGTSVRASVRQALPQLLEYAFWPEHVRADELVIVSHLPPTAESDRYLRFLRRKFGLPISYQQFKLRRTVLS